VLLTLASCEVAQVDPRRRRLGCDAQGLEQRCPRGVRIALGRVEEGERDTRFRSIRVQRL
jgi:hypothetical protein